MVGYLAVLQFSQVRGVVWVEELPLLDPEQAAVETARISPKAKVVSFFNSRLHSIIRVSAGTACRSTSFQLSAPLNALWRLNLHYEVYKNILNGQLALGRRPDFVGLDPRQRWSR